MTPDDIAKILDELGKRLGPTGEQVYRNIFVQVQIEAWISLIIIPVLLMAISILLRSVLADPIKYEQYIISKRKEVVSYNKNALENRAIFYKELKTEENVSNYEAEQISNDQYPLLDKYKPDNDPKAILMVLWAVLKSLFAGLAALGLLLQLSNLPSTLTTLLNPNYATLQRIFSLLENVK